MPVDIRTGNATLNDIYRNMKADGFPDSDIDLISKQDIENVQWFFGASAEDREAYLEQLRSDPINTMTTEEYADYVASQQAMQKAQREGEVARLKAIDEARKNDPEVAKTIGPFGQLTPYGVEKAKAERALKYPAKTTADGANYLPWVLGALGLGVAYMVFKGGE